MAQTQAIEKTTLLSRKATCRPGDIGNLVDLFQCQATTYGDQVAFTFLREDGGQKTLTYRELDRQARAIAARLQQHAQSGHRALLVYSPGLDFICGFLGCVYAGVLAVPATYPKPRRPMPRLTAIASDCNATLALTTSQTLHTLDFERIQPDLRSLDWLATDEVSDADAAQWTNPKVSGNSLAFLQYTSGSTSEPKGVMVSHANLLYNLEMIRQGFDLRASSTCDDPYRAVFWLPAYHDMGLIGGILEPLYVGGQSILMPPASFLQRPIRWLKALSEHRANISGAPNFAYDLCVSKITREQRETLDLGNWRLAFCGAEPIHADTIERFTEAFGPCGFRAEAFYPCYGLAEATLIVSGGIGPARPVVKRVLRGALTDHRVEDANGHPQNQIQRLVGCGSALLDQEIVIADPVSHRRCEADHVGEIWIKGPSVARGYWNRPDENERTFRARLADSCNGGFLRTGDLGFISNGQLFITGRVKDVIIIRGRNHYPQDIERTVQQAHPALHATTGAAFSIDVDNHERLVVIQEIDRQNRETDLDEVIRQVRNAIAREHELDIHAVVLIRQASLPMTTSGKAQRNLCRQRFLRGELKVIAQWVRESSVNRNGSNGKHGPNARPLVNGTSASPHHDRWEAKSSGSNHVQPRAASDEQHHGQALLGLDRPERPLSAEEIDRLGERIEAWILDWLIEQAEVPAAEVDRERPFAEYGIDSLAAVELSQELEDRLGVQLTPIMAWNYPTPALLARFLARQAAGTGPETTDAQPSGEAPVQSDFERLLAEVEAMSESDAESALGGNLGEQAP